MPKLSGDFISGFASGEGCFALTYRKDPQKNRVYFRWTALFAIMLRSDDVQLLEEIKLALGCGNISLTSGAARFQVYDTKALLEKVIPFFDKHQLHGKKLEDFLLWRQAVFIIAKNKLGNNWSAGTRGFLTNTWPEEDLNKLRVIREQMTEFKSKRSKYYKWS